MLKSTKITLAVICSLAWFAAAAEASITITNNSTRVYARDYDGSLAWEYFTGEDIPASDALDATLSDQFYSRAEVDYSNSGGQTVLALDFAQRRAGGYGDFTYAIQRIRFTADANAAYTATGHYDIDDPDGSSGDVYLRSYLRVLDGYTDPYVYDSIQISRSTNDEKFVLGETEGETANIFAGSLTGSLIAGQVYEYYTYAVIQAYPDADSGVSSANGNFTLTIGERNDVVPEPLSLFVWAGLASVAGLVRYRRGA